MNICSFNHLLKECFVNITLPAEGKDTLQQACSQHWIFLLAAVRLYVVKDDMLHGLEEVAFDSGNVILLFLRRSRKMRDCQQGYHIT